MHVILCDEPDSLLGSLGISPTTKVVALAGAGGKTTLMFALAREASDAGSRVVTTTSTKIFPPETSQSPAVLLVGDDPDLQGLPDLLQRHGHVTVAASFHRESGKLVGIDEKLIARCAAHADLVVVEADGASGRGIKAPEAWEPVIPSCADLVVYVIAIDCLFFPADPRIVFRLPVFSRLTGVASGDIITPEGVAALVSHPEGGLKGVPARAEFAVFLNRYQAEAHAQAVCTIASRLSADCPERIGRVVIRPLLHRRTHRAKEKRTKSRK